MNLPAIAPGDAPRVAVVMLSALGDVVHTLPVVSALKAHAPRAHITWILQPVSAELVRGHPAVDEVVVFERSRGLGAYGDLRLKLKGRRFDVVLALQPYLKAGLITAMLHAPVKLGFDRARARDLNWLFTTHRIPPRPRQHIQDEFFEFLDALGVPHGEPVWGLAPTAEETARARELVREAAGSKLVGFVVATSKPEKNWMPERFAELADRLAAESGARVVLLGGPSAIERAAADVILARSTAKPIDALGKGLRTLLALLPLCDVVVSSDTGPYHMAVAMNVPAVGLYGYTNPKRVGPYRRFTDLVVDAYGVPGEDYPISTEYRHQRIDRISVDGVAHRISTALLMKPKNG